MNPNSVISHRWDDKRNYNYLAWDKEPYVKGKIIQIPNDANADKFEEKTNGYISQRVKGWNIFIVSAGFTKPPPYQVPDAEVQLIINTMAVWYLNNIVPTFSSLRHKQFKTKEKIA